MLADGPCLCHQPLFQLARRSSTRASTTRRRTSIAVMTRSASAKPSRPAAPPAVARQCTRTTVAYDDPRGAGIRRSRRARMRASSASASRGGSAPSAASASAGATPPDGLAHGTTRVRRWRARGAARACTAAAHARSRGVAPPPRAGEAKCGLWRAPGQVLPPSSPPWPSACSSLSGAPALACRPRFGAASAAASATPALAARLAARFLLLAIARRPPGPASSTGRADSSAIQDPGAHAAARGARAGPHDHARGPWSTAPAVRVCAPAEQSARHFFFFFFFLRESTQSRPLPPTGRRWGPGAPLYVNKPSTTQPPPEGRTSGEGKGEFHSTCKKPRHRWAQRSTTAASRSLSRDQGSSQITTCLIVFSWAL